MSSLSGVLVLGGGNRGLGFGSVGISEFLAGPAAVSGETEGGVIETGEGSAAAEGEAAALFAWGKKGLRTGGEGEGSARDAEDDSDGSKSDLVSGLGSGSRTDRGSGISVG